MPRQLLIAVAALRLVAPGVNAWSAVPARHATHPDAFSTLDRTTITLSPNGDELILELPAMDLPAGTMVEPPASLGEFPVNGSIYGFRAELLDGHGRRLPMEMLHHMNVMNPNERELFLPISRRVLAAGKETGAVRFPWLLFGAPVREGEQVLANVMLHNATAESFHGVRVRLILNYVPERRPWPLFSVVPWQLDVGFPVGDKSFDLPPGQSERSYEGSPAVSGKMVMVGAHLHEYGRAIELWDATTNQLLWRGEPSAAAPGQPSTVPITKFWGLKGIGLPLTPEHRYRVRVIYENSTGHAIPSGGMGVIAGIFIPDRKAVWPKTNPDDLLYQQDLLHFKRTGKPTSAPLSHSHGSH
jgi:hypothetical protein